MHQICKYPLQITDQQQVLMPRNAKILAAGIDNMNNVCLWASVNDEAPKMVRAIKVVGTGNPFEDTHLWKHVSTVAAYPFIWHIFEFYIEGPEVEE